jgi:hypothetical protein
MSARYAADTSVSSDASRAEIERVLRRYGATSFAYGWEAKRAILGFVLSGRQIRFTPPLPDPAERRFTHTPGRGQVRTPEAAQREWEQAVRQSWRALALVIKAKLEAVAAGIVSAEDEFLAFTVLPGGRTVGEEIGPGMTRALAGQPVPSLLPALESRKGEPR